MTRASWALERSRVAAVVAAVGVMGSLPWIATTAESAAEPNVDAGSVVVRWNTALLEAVRDSKLGPPMVARALAMAHTCMYDAWAAYDATALGTRMGAALRRPARERTLVNLGTAVSYAAYRAAVDLFPASRLSVFDPLMTELGHDVGDTSTDPSTPAGTGNRACAEVLAFRHHDGSNQLGDEPGGAPGVPYSDYTGYQPVNHPMVVSDPFDPTAVEDPSRWQPLTFRDGSGALVTQRFLAPHWNRVTPFAMVTGDQNRSATGPPVHGSERFDGEVRQVVQTSAGLTDEQKMIAEYWSDGPASETPPGHWNLFAQLVSRRDHHGPGLRGIRRDVKLFFALNNALFDASITSWDNKIAFDSVRPITAVRYALRGQTVAAWGGPYQGTRLIDGSQWLPYQDPTFPSPPFGEYSSGHSTFSAAAADILRRFTGSDRFGASVRLPAGSSRVEPGAVPASDVTLRWSTFSAAAEQAGLSRRYGGIHFEQADVDGRAGGRACAALVWARTQELVSGTGSA